MGATNINLDGSETTVINGLGLMGSDMDGAALFEQCKGMDEMEFVDTLKGLIDVGYVDADSSSFYSVAEIRSMKFKINPPYLKAIREAIDPEEEPRKSKRVRRE